VRHRGFVMNPGRVADVFLAGSLLNSKTPPTNWGSRPSPISLWEVLTLCQKEAWLCFPIRRTRLQVP